MKLALACFDDFVGLSRELFLKFIQPGERVSVDPQPLRSWIEDPLFTEPENSRRSFRWSLLRDHGVLLRRIRVWKVLRGNVRPLFTRA